MERQTIPTTAPQNRAKHYINLTAGLVVFGSYKIDNFCRLQSSHLESKTYNKFFMSIPDDMLLHLTIGTHCIVIDATSNNKGKVIKIGIPIIKYVLNRRWFNREIKLDGMDINWLRKVYENLDKEVKKKLDYYKQFITYEDIRLDGISIRIEKEDTERIVDDFLNLIKRDYIT